MSELSVRKPSQKKNWALNRHAFNRLLSWLDEGADSNGLRYLEMSQRLVAYFDRKNCPAPDELADETLNRVARRLEEEGVIETETPAKYCYTVARFVFNEHLRGVRKARALFDDMRRLSHGNILRAAEAGDEKNIKERMLDCLEQCAGGLEAPSRELIIRYYAGKGRTKIEHRRALAEELQITMNALSVRACRIRERLEGCVRQCTRAG